MAQHGPGLPDRMTNNNPRGHVRSSEAEADTGARESWRGIFDVLTAHLQDTVIVTDAVGRIREVFGSYASVAGWRREQIVGKSVARFIHPLDLATALGRLIVNAADPALSGRYRLEVRALQADGTYRQVEAMVSNRLSDPELRGLVITIRDIAPRKEAELGQRASEERFQAVTDLSDDMVAIVTADSKVVYQSAAVEHVLGYRPAERIGGSAFDFVHPDDLPAAAAAMQRLATDPAAGGRQSLEVRLQHRDGSWRWIQATGTNLMGHAAVRGIVLNGRDVTKRKEAEIALTKAQARLEAALWGARVGFYIYDVAADRAEMSPQFFEITGIDPARWRTDEHPWDQRIHPRDRRQYFERLAAHLAGKTEYLEAEYRLRTPRGWLWLLDRARVMERDAEGRPVTVAGTAIDISARKQLEREIIDTVGREQQRLSQELHDGLGQELTGIALLLRSIATRARRERGAAGADGDIDIAVDHLNAAIRNARALAHGLHPVRADHGGLTGALAALAANASLGRDLGVDFDAARWSDPAIPDDVANHIYRIAQEALGNAMRHARASRISITLGTTDDTLELLVRDDGRGIGEKALHAPGLGRRIMTYRAQMIGGSVNWVAAPDGGTDVVLQVPWHAPREA